VDRAAEHFAGSASGPRRITEMAEARLDAASVPERRTMLRRARLTCTTLLRYAKVFPIGQPSAWLWLGLEHWLHGRKPKAVRAWRRSVAAGERLAMPYETGRAHLELGRHLDATDDARSEHLARAREIFEHLGAAHDERRVRTLLAAE